MSVMVHGRQARATLLTVSLLVAIAACSSTQRSSNGTSQDAPDGPLGSSATMSPGAVAPFSTTGARATKPGGLSGSPAQGSASSSTTGVGGGQPGSPAAGAPRGGGVIPIGVGTHGVTDKTISIGLATFNTAALNAAASALTGNPGNAVSSSSDFKKAAKVVVEYINAHGGVAGRKLEAVLHEVNVGNEETASGRDQESQSACADWTQDHHVFAFQNAFSGNSVPCAKATGTVVLSDPNAAGQPWLSESMFKQARSVWYGPDMMLAERHDKNLVNALWNQGFFGRNAKVGVLIEDQPGSKAGVAGGMIPALASHGIKPVAQVVYPDIFQSPWQNEILAMQRAGVDHILLSTTAGQSFPSLFLMRAAENQHYRPKWGMASDHWPVALGATGAPHAQMANIMGMGWVPNLDTGDSSHQSTASDICDKIGVNSGQGDAVRLYCEDLFFFKFALDNASEVSLPGMDAALGRVAGRYVSTLTIAGASFFTATRHDGPSVYRIFGYDSRCDSSGALCIKYVSPTRSMS